MRWVERPYDERFTRWSAVWSTVWVVSALAMWFKVIPGFPGGLLLILLFWRPLLDSVRGAASRIRPTVRATLTTFLIALTAGVLMQSFVDPLLASLFGIDRLSSANTQWATNFLKDAPVLATVLFVVLGPLGEELSYRYGLFRLISRFSVIAGHLVTALVFALQHVVVGWLSGAPEQLLLMPGHAVTSAIWTVAYRRTGNLMVCFGSHLLLNALGVTFMFLNG
ncbi:CPBP family intramembrane glutamic endopeptidase [Austwickia chelonae]|uniref:CPBP family intramembrane glutamic endopeptidase n=1 Tax=Austwickia chelonae TaxID=100225 RepID=UPI0013C304CE|nr:CPBP family intramembrane glutamic endopeptidase [Austwickia chelonae]